MNPLCETGDNQTITYGVRKTYFFHENLSVANEDLKITTLNLPVLSSLAQMVYGKRIVLFFTLTRKAVLCYFFTSEMSENSHNSTFRVKISV